MEAHEINIARFELFLQILQRLEQVSVSNEPADVRTFRIKKQPFEEFFIYGGLKDLYAMGPYFYLGT